MNPASCGSSTVVLAERALQLDWREFVDCASQLCLAKRERERENSCRRNWAAGQSSLLSFSLSLSLSCSLPLSWAHCTEHCALFLAGSGSVQAVEALALVVASASVDSAAICKGTEETVEEIKKQKLKDEEEEEESSSKVHFNLFLFLLLLLLWRPCSAGRSIFAKRLCWLVISRTFSDLLGNWQFSLLLKCAVVVGSDGGGGGCCTVAHVPKLWLLLLFLIFLI